jgi:autotransporter-associated beta strand protein
LRSCNGGTTGSIVGNVLDNATLAFNRSNATTFAGTISGSGAVNQIGSGTTILTATNTYTGGTTISGGVLQVDGSDVRSFPIHAPFRGNRGHQARDIP